MEKVQCPACNGQGTTEVNILTGYVSHEMAMDTCDMNYEGEPIYEKVEIPCAYCEGTGLMDEDEAERCRHPIVISTDEDIPF